MPSIRRLSRDKRDCRMLSPRNQTSHARALRLTRVSEVRLFQQLVAEVWEVAAVSKAAFRKEIREIEPPTRMHGQNVRPRLLTVEGGRSGEGVAMGAQLGSLSTETMRRKFGCAAADAANASRVAMVRNPFRLSCQRVSSEGIDLSERNSSQFHVFLVYRVDHPQMLADDDRMRILISHRLEFSLESLRWA